MQLHLRYFAGLREALGLSSEYVTFLDVPYTVQDVLTALRERGGHWAEALADVSAFRVAVDQCMGSLSTEVQEGAEVAFFPPVTGG